MHDATDIARRAYPNQHRPGFAMLRHLLHLIARGLALFLGTFTLFNVARGFISPGFDASIWWIDLRILPSYVQTALLAALGAAFTTFALRLAPTESVSSAVRWIAAFIAVIFSTVALSNTSEVIELELTGFIDPAIPIPFSLLVALGLALVAIAAIDEELGGIDGRHPVPPGPFAIVASAASFILLFPLALALVLFFGGTDYTRSADAAVVFGARAYADGTPSVPLSDRVLTACDLYHEGNVETLIFSGGPADGTMHEVEAMRRLAIRNGVDEGDIVLDRGGVNTEASVDGTMRIGDSLGAHRVLAVSHGYHLPRIKMIYQRRGRAVCTVPAADHTGHGRSVRQLAREVVAFWYYYLTA